MSNRNILSSAQAYLNSTSSVRIAHLITIQLAKAVNGQSFLYVTDYHANIYDPSVDKTFLAGRVTKVGDLRQQQGIKHDKLSINLAGEFQEEIDRALVQPGDGSYVGNSIVVMRAFIDNTTGGIIPFDATNNGPMEYFRGQLTDANIKEDVTSGSSTITYSCANHFEDFTRVNGRLTSDTDHRGLVTDTDVASPTYGKQIPGIGAKKDIYQNDLGFMHADRVSSITASYMGTETQLVEKSSWFGFKNSYEMRDVPVQKTIDLNLNLAARYLPVIYGIRKTSAFPIFADLERAKPSSLWIAYAVCEGEIDGFLDFYIDGSPALCFNDSEVKDRECVGNMKYGHTIAGFLGTTTGSPTTDRQKYTITKEAGKWEIYVYHGSSLQAASNPLKDIAATINLTDPLNPTGGFMLQTVPGEEYWGSKHTLNDTAYIVVRMDLTDEQVQAPKIEPVVQGKKVETFNLDGTSAGLAYTLNPVWHLYDYMTSFTYGGSLATSIVNTKSFAESAAILNTRDTSYESAWIDYWRYVGWLANSNLNRQVMQCNMKLDTDLAVFKNLESIISQMDGTLNLLGGKYKLSLEHARAPVAHISIDEAMSNLSAKDASGKNKWNSITAQITDPAKGWSSNSITFFNGKFKTQDNGLDKKGNVGFPHVTNFYTARAWCERMLNKSRYSRDYSLSTYYKYIDLAPNDVIEVSYSRWNMNRHKLIVTDITILASGIINLGLKDYDPVTYDITKQAKTNVEDPVIIPALSKPKGLVLEAYTGSEAYVSGVVKWDPNPEPKVDAYDIWGVATNNADTYVFQNVVSPTQLLNGRLYHLLKNLTIGTSYTIQIRARGRDERGISRLSGWSYITFAVTNVQKLPNITGLKIINLEPGFTNRFVGPDIHLQWDPSPAAVAANYTLEVVSSETTDPDSASATVLGTYTVPHIVGSQPISTSYTRMLNKTDFQSNNSKVGIYRNVKFRVKTNGSGGEISPSWVMTE